MGHYEQGTPGEDYPDKEVRLWRWAAVLAIGAAVVVVTATASSAPSGDCQELETFAKSPVGQFPVGWKPRKDEGTSIYQVLEESGVRFLRAAADGQGIQAARQYEWDLASYPVLAWSWRPQEFPRGADEREGSTNDSVLSVYMLVPHSRIRGPKAVKYVWSEVVPTGTRLSSNNGLTQGRVLRSGRPDTTGWVEERVDVLQDFRTFFKEGDAPRPAGIAVLSDADQTRSRAVGDYANFRVCRG